MQGDALEPVMYSGLDRGSVSQLGNLRCGGSADRWLNTVSPRPLSLLPSHANVRERLLKEAPCPYSQSQKPWVMS